MTVFLISEVSPIKSDSEAQRYFCLMVLLFFNFWLLRSPWVWICNQQMGQNRSLMCRKMLMGWAWSNTIMSPPISLTSELTLGPTVTPDYKGSGIRALPVCPGKTSEFGEQLINLSLSLFSGNYCGVRQHLRSTNLKACKNTSAAL